MSSPRCLRGVGRAAVGLLLLGLSGCAGAGAAAGGPAPTRVLVYNVHAGKDAAGADNLRRVAELVLTSGADVALLQEVDRRTERSGRVDQVSELAGMTGFHAAFGRTLDYQGGEYGIAVLSRWPITGDTLLPLPVTPPQERAGGAYEPRGVLHVRVAAPDGALHVLNTHLDPSRHDGYRHQEMETVLATAERLRGSGDPVLFGGDLNAEPGSEVMARVQGRGWRDAWPGCGEGDGLTFPAGAPVKRIDYLVLSAGLRCRSATVIDSRASDHLPVLFVVSRQVAGR